MEDVSESLGLGITDLLRSWDQEAGKIWIMEGRLPRGMRREHGQRLRDGT